MTKRTILLVIIVLQCIITKAQVKRVEIPGSELRTITSTIVYGQEYQLHIQVPSGYANSTKKYPVVYLMDSQWDFPLLTSLYGEQYYDGFIPELIIVGVTWGGVNPKPDSLRGRDYTPTNEKWMPQSGGAAAFLSFMKTELFPYIESNYRADRNDRTLVGCSLGGLFTLFALFTEPGLFQRYVASSPAFEWGNGAIYEYEKAYYSQKVTAPARLYMSMGGVEVNEPNFEKLVKYLTDRKYTNIQMKTRVLENTGHSGTKGEGYARGLQYAFERPSLKLDAATLNRYAGDYQVANGPAITIKNENNQLVMYIGREKHLLYASGETEFYSTSSYLFMHFKTENGKVSGFQIDQFSNSQFIAKK